MTTHSARSLRTESNIYISARPSIHISSALINLLIVVSFAVDLLVPLLITERILPDATRWLSDLCILILVILLIFRMIVFDRFPVGFWLILGLSVIGITQATLQGQFWGVTLWGWWETFQYPLIAVFAYLNPHWPDNFPEKLRRICTIIIVAEVLVQIVQYLTGEPIGDDLAGTFGRHGVSKLLTLLVFIVSVVLGYGVSSGKWRTFLYVFGLGIMSSVLAENKIFPVATSLLAVEALVLYLILGGKLSKFVPYASILFVGLVIFFLGYNYMVPAAERRSLDQYLFDPQARDTYNQLIKPSSTGTTDFNIGRDFALQYGWNFIVNHVDRSVLVFGLGVGARTESTSLGFVGLAYEQDGLGLTLGTGAMVLLQEMGLMGVVALSLFIIVVCYQLLSDMRRYPTSSANEARAALLIFTVLWPLWLWYKPVFEHRATVVLYWTLLGYVYWRRQQEQLMEQEYEPAMSARLR